MTNALEEHEVILRIPEYVYTVLFLLIVVLKDLFKQGPFQQIGSYKNYMFNTVKVLIIYTSINPFYVRLMGMGLL